MTILAKDSFVFRSKYAEIVKQLKDKDSPPLFKTYYQAYVFGAIYGILNGCPASLDTNSGGDEATIKAEAMNNAVGLEKYDLIRKIVLLTESNRNLDFKDRLDNALRFDNPIDADTPSYLVESSKYDQNTNLLNSYAIGGLVAFYEKYKCCSDDEDKIMFMYNTLQDFIKQSAVKDGDSNIDLIFKPRQ